MNNILEMLSLDGFFASVQEQTQAFPREMMLAEGAMLGAMGLGVVLFLLIGLVKRSATAVVAASLMGMTGLLIAYFFGRLPFLPEGSLMVLQALFITSVILFFTVTIRAARDNPLVGLILLLVMLGALGLGAAGIMDLYPAETPLRIMLAGVAFCAVVLILFQALGGERRAALLSIPVLLSAGALLAMFIGNQANTGHWIGAVLPFGMLTTGVFFAGVMALIPVRDAVKAEPRAAEPAFAEEAVIAFGDEEEQPLPEGLTDFQEEEPAPFVATREEPEEKKKSRSMLGIGKKEPQERREPVAEPAPQEEPAPEIKTESPISALWGKQGKTAAPVTADGALWDWSAMGDLKASAQTPGLFGLAATDELTPENIRGLVADSSLDEFDDQVLGGTAPTTGSLDFKLALKNGETLRFTGQRYVDDDGLVERIETRVEKLRDEAEPEAVAEEEPVAPVPGFSADELKQALAAGQIRAWFQPIIRVQTGDIAGFEALARWHKPGEDEALTADAFIPSVMEAGLEKEVITVIAAEAAKELADWLAAEPGKGQFVSFNVSAASMIDSSLVKIVQSEIKKHNLPEGSLVVELTESHVTSNQSKALQVAKGLRQAGARLALDDLGAGYSSLNQLNKFRFDIIKTDKSLMASVAEDEHARTLLGGVIDLARKLGMQVIAEGTENAQVAEVLKQMNCDFAQGYHYGAPEPADGGAPAPVEDQPVTIMNLR